MSIENLRESLTIQLHRMEKRTFDYHDKMEHSVKSNDKQTKQNQRKSTQQKNPNRTCW